LALLQLAARGQDVRATLPKIVQMLDSDELLRRIYGWDALRLVFSEEAKKIEDYNPRSSAEDCRAKAAKLREIMKNKSN
jgi:hypothetical protein